MGALSSWAVMAMSHHLLVFWAFVSVYPSREEKFTDYAIIGDDVVIWDPKVAFRYRQILSLLGIDISEAKSNFWIPDYNIVSDDSVICKFLFSRRVNGHKSPEN